MSFILDSRLSSSSYKIIDWPLSEVRLKDNVHFPWIILIPRVSPEIIEIFQLTDNQQEIMMNEITQLSKKMSQFFHADKMNIGTLGNIVSQLHVHVIARFQNDLAWPHSLWQASIPEKKYSDHNREKLIADLREILT